MKATDFRDATFQGLRGDLAGMRKAVYEAWMVYGPGTTRDVAAKSGIDLLMLRPRTTELVQCGLLIVDPKLQVPADGHQGREGVYRAAYASEWERWREGVVSGQLNLI